MRSQKDPRRTFARWILKLEEYSYNITYRPGKENNLPDYLSRNPNVAIDAKVQDESIFEDKVFTLKTNVRVETRWDAFLMRKQQNQDPVTKDALNQLEKEGRVSTGQLCNVAEDLNVASDLLLFRDRVVVPSEAQDEVMRRVHAAGHFGQKRTLQNLQKSYFWIGMARDTRKYCRSCLTCQKAKGSNRVKVPIQEFRVEGLGPGDLVAMDIGTLPWADERFRYFLCMVDVFTRYIELAPLQDQTAASLIREFERGWIFRGHGVPRGLLSDQARNIDGVEVRRMCGRLGIEKRHSSPYHPQADGLVERSIGLVKQVARCLTLDCQLPNESWPDILPEVAFWPRMIGKVEWTGT